MYDISEERGVDHMHSPLYRLAVLLPHSPPAHEVCGLPAEEPGVGDACDPDHVLHKLTLHVHVVGERDGLCVCVCACVCVHYEQESRISNTSSMCTS